MDVQFHNGKILHGDVLDRLKDIPDETVDTISTSPPYLGLRDYGVEGQLGLEPDFRDYLKKLYLIMDELKRVLKKTGTCWINLGDTYGSHRSNEESLAIGFEKQEREPLKGYEKSRLGIPERFYIHCIDDGWIARNHIPWYKANSMPSSIKDRFTNKWESIFFFAKEKKYYFNLDAVRIPTLTDSKPFNVRVRDNITGRAQMKLGDQAWTATEEEMEKYNRDGTRKMLEVGGQTTQGIHRNREKGKEDWKKQDNVVMGNGRIDPTKKNFNKRYKESKYIESMSLQYSNAPDRIKEKRLDGVDHEVGLGTIENFDGIERFGTGKWQRHYDKDGNCLGCGKHYTKHQVTNRAQGSANRDERQKDDYVWCNSKGKNPGDVFFINPRPFPDAHFATFPPELPEKIIKCACPEGGTILDPFLGSGTVALVAEQLNRKWIGIELSGEYIEICKKRLERYNSLRLDEFL